MTHLYLNDILHLTEEQVNNSKIGLNMSWDTWEDGKKKKVSGFERWYNSEENNRNVDFTYSSYQGRNRNFTYVGQWCFGFARLDNPDHWLLVSAGEITSMPTKDKKGPCGHKELQQFKGLLGRLIINYHRGNKFARYIFKMSEIIKNAEVLEILPNIYEPIKFNGFENVHLKFSTLKLILDIGSERYQDYKAALKGIKGIYCLTDGNDGKFYIGSASGENGILQRWSNYIDNKTGGNQALINLYNEKGDSYFEKYFEYTLLETFDKTTPRNKIIARENYWKTVFKTKENGYNKN